MAKGFLIFVVIALLSLTGGIQSLSLVNNVTVSSDVLSDLFFKQIRDNDKLLNLSLIENRDSQAIKCILSLREIITQFPSLKVVPFFDAWGKFPSGILYGSFYDLGNFDQCVQTSVDLSPETGVVSGQYCFASIPLIQQNEFNLRGGAGAGAGARNDLAELLKLTIGICVPNSCPTDFLNYVFQMSVGDVFNGSLSGVVISSCTEGKKPEFKAWDIVGITIFSLFAAWMVASTLYDFLMGYFGKKPEPLLLAFSILTNGKKLFAINTKPSPNTIECLTGIRVFSMIWVMYAHTYGFSATVPMINTIEVPRWLKAPWSMHVINATVSVDSFFFISGVLVAWLGFRELDKTRGKLNVVMMYVHRYIRLTPPVAAGILFLFCVNKFIGTGPYREKYIELDQCNGYNWWPVLLYIQNYFVQDTACYPQTWYLAIDFQLYILSPLLLIPMWKWGKKFSLVLPVLALLSIGCVMATYITEGYTDLKGMDNPHEYEKVYIPMHTRYSPWIVGFGLGYFMYMSRQKTIRPPKILQLVGWVVCFVTLVAIVFAPYFTISSRGYGTVFEAAMYEGLKRVSWAIALAWITFACQFGFGGVVNSFLSHPFWQPLGRLTYSLYLVHLFVMIINLGMVRTSFYFSDYNEILSFWSTFGMSLVVATAWTLAFESPILVLEKALFGGLKRKEKTVLVATATAPPPTTVVHLNTQ